MSRIVYSSTTTIKIEGKKKTVTTELRTPFTSALKEYVNSNGTVEAADKFLKSTETTANNLLQEMKARGMEIPEEKPETLVAPTGLSEETTRRINEMYAKVKPHVDVFPTPPHPDDIVIPTGGLAKCVCSPDCTKELPQPAYRILGSSGEDERWCLGSDGIMTPESFLARVAELVMGSKEIGGVSVGRRNKRN